MSFEKLSKKELVEVADKFGVNSSGTKAEILAELEAEGVTFDLYETLRDNAVPADIEEVVDVVEPKHLVKAKSAPEAGDGVILAYRGKASQTVKDRVWSKASPYVVVSADEAAAIINKYGWVFEEATAREVEEFYS